MNDASGEWDDDLLVGSVHMLETVEFLYYLQNEISYDGWLSVDITLYREDAIRACQQCIDAMGRFAKAANSLDMAKLKELQAKMDAVGVVELVHEALRAQFYDSICDISANIDESVRDGKLPMRKSLSQVKI